MPRRRPPADAEPPAPAAPAAAPRPSQTVLSRHELPGGVVVEVVPLAALRADDDNANRHTPEGMELVRGSMRRHGAGRGVAVDRDRRLIAGNATVDAAAAAGVRNVIVVRTTGDELVATQRDDLTLDEAPARELAIADNFTAHRNYNLDAEILMRQQAEMGVDLSAEGIGEADLAAMREAAAGGDGDGEPGDGSGDPPAPGGNLSDEFGAPPFTVLDARQGYWQVRKREWLAVGAAGCPMTHESHVMNMGFSYRNGTIHGAGQTMPSTFDPVLTELMVRWFNLPGGHVLDPFAGEATSGMVCAALGCPFTGIEIRDDQVRANREHYAAAASRNLWLDKPVPTWICGDSTGAPGLVPAGYAADFVWTSPPYFTLENYGGGGGSDVRTWADFCEWYERVLSAVVTLLKPDRFFALKVGEARDRTGGYVGFVPETVRILSRLGLAFLNEAILITAVGSLALRAGSQFRRGRKLGKGHQNILVFFNGDPARIRDVFPEDCGGVDLSGDAPGDGAAGAAPGDDDDDNGAE